MGYGVALQLTRQVPQRRVGQTSEGYCLYLEITYSDGSAIASIEVTRWSLEVPSQITLKAGHCDKRGQNISIQHKEELAPKGRYSLTGIYMGPNNTVVVQYILRHSHKQQVVGGMLQLWLVRLKIIDAPTLERAME